MNGYRMRDLRQKAGLRQNEVALELGLHSVTVCKWELTNKELPKAYGETFERLVNDAERVFWIKSTRRARRKAK